MAKLDTTVQDIHKLDTNAAVGRETQKVHAVSRLLVTFCYIFVTASFSKYNLCGVLSMVLYLIVTGFFYELSFRECVRKIWPVFLMAALVGAANPFFDRAVYGSIYGFGVTYGMVSMLTLMLKGIFCVTASCFLVMSTGMEEICYALRRLLVPKELVTVSLLIYRYLIVLLKEVKRMSQAYRLRAPAQRGIHWRAWGTFVGQLLLRSTQRADTVYESMLLRGFDGEFAGGNARASMGKSIAYFAGWVFVFVLLRIFPVFEMAGGLLLS